MDNTPYQLNKRLVRESFDRAAPGYDDVALLQQTIAQRLLERLDLIKLQPQRILDVGAGTGQLTLQLTRRYKNCEVIALDLAPAMLKLARQRLGTLDKWFGKQRFICGDADHLPLADNSVDMIISNFAIQWCSDLDQTFTEFQRVLKPDGLLLFTTFGPDTLKELRQAWRTVDGAIHVNSFIDMHDIGDAMMRAKFSDPVMDTERLTLTYKDGMAVMRDLKAMGAHNVSAGRSHALTGKQKLQQMLSAYDKFKNSDGLLPATYEVVYGHAWGTTPAPQHHDGEIHIPLTQIGRR
ncbi:MAG: malonyl-ACP O-methyltransferase BioC [Pseudomonadota bacterium]|nr:malonyl-ACP O-methyltransferase BioC [Pseudomonadota bacterium]